MRYVFSMSTVREWTLMGNTRRSLIRWFHLIREGKSPVIYGKGDQTMDFVFVEDVARASILALKAAATDEVFNVQAVRRPHSRNFATCFSKP